MSGIGDMERMVKLTGEKMRYRRIPEWCKDEALPTLIKYFDQVTASLFNKINGRVRNGCS